MSIEARRLSPYPYDIPSPPKLDSKPFNRRDLWDALEFFRIEALLRSKVVWNLYGQATRRTNRLRGEPPVWNAELWHFLYGENRLKLKGKADAHMRRLLHDESLRRRFAVGDGWAVLLGSHHRYLTPDPDRKGYRHHPFWISDGIVDLSLLVQTPITGLSFQVKDLKNKQTHYSYLRIDNTVPTEANLQVLRRYLQDKYKAAMVTIARPTMIKRTGVQTHPYHPGNNPPITDITAWVKYLQCYDLSHDRSLTKDEIATKVYGNAESVGEVATVNQAIFRVRRLIAAAVNLDAWPPSRLK